MLGLKSRRKLRDVRESVGRLLEIASREHEHSFAAENWHCINHYAGQIVAYRTILNTLKED